MLLIYLQALDTPEEKDKFEQIYMKYRNLMFHVANTILQNEHDAEDAVHQAFLAIADNINKIEEPSSPRTKGYVATIAEHKAIDIIRQNTNKPCTYMDDITLDAATMSIAMEYCKENTLSQCILKLPANYRQIIMLKYFHGYSSAEIAEMLGMSKSNAIKLDQRAKKKLYELCKKENLL